MRCLKIERRLESGCRDDGGVVQLVADDDVGFFTSDCSTELL